jgi:hypothetical protein
LTHIAWAATCNKHLFLLVPVFVLSFAFTCWSSIAHRTKNREVCCRLKQLRCVTKRGCYEMGRAISIPSSCHLPTFILSLVFTSWSCCMSQLVRCASKLKSPGLRYATEDYERRDRTKVDIKMDGYLLHIAASAICVKTQISSTTTCNKSPSS